jgi:hypothetical protein
LLACKREFTESYNFERGSNTDPPLAVSSQNKSNNITREHGAAEGKFDCDCKEYVADALVPAFGEDVPVVLSEQRSVGGLPAETRKSPQLTN